MVKIARIILTVFVVAACCELLALEATKVGVANWPKAVLVGLAASHVAAFIALAVCVTKRLRSRKTSVEALSNSLWFNTAALMLTANMMLFIVQSAVR